MHTQEIIQFTFGIDNTFKRTESQQMTSSYICNQSEIGLGNIHQFRYIAGVTGTHFYNRHFMRRVEP